MSAFPGYRIKKIIPAEDNWFGLFVNNETQQIKKLRVAFFAEIICVDDVDENIGEDTVKALLASDEPLTAEIQAYIYTMRVGFSSWWKWDDRFEWDTQQAEFQITPDYDYENFKGYYHKDDLDEIIKELTTEQNKEEKENV